MSFKDVRQQCWLEAGRLFSLEIATNVPQPQQSCGMSVDWIEHGSCCGITQAFSLEARGLGGRRAASIMGTLNRCDVSGLAAQWERIESVRERVRGGGFMVEPVNPDGALDASNKLAIKNIDVLILVLVRMADTKVLKVPDIEPLRTCVGDLYALMNRTVDSARIDDDAWALRHLAGFVKRKAQKSLVSLATCMHDFISLSLSPSLPPSLSLSLSLFCFRRQHRRQ